MQPAETYAPTPLGESELRGSATRLTTAQIAQLKDVPVIMLTGKATREAVLKGMTGGADGYITKPFEPESLLRAIRTVLGVPEPPPGAAWQMP